MRRVLALSLPLWSIDRVRRRTRPRAESRARRARPEAILLLSAHHGRQVVARCCERARSAGVRPGMDAAHARALLPQATVRQEPYREDRDLLALQAFSQWMHRFSPLVAPDPPEGVLLDVTGCERLFGGEPRLVETVGAAAAHLGFKSRSACAPSLGAAWALARYGPPGAIVGTPTALKEALAPLPVRALRLDDATRAALGEVAIDRVGHLYPLSRLELAERFGDDLLLRLDQALGAVDEPLIPIRPRARLAVERVFEGPVTRLEAIELTVDELLKELIHVLAQEASGVLRLQLVLERAGAERVAEVLELGAPCADTRHLATLLRPVIERLHLGFGAERLALEALRAGRLRAGEHRLWPDDEPPATGALDAEVGRVVDRLVNRFGPERLHRFRPRDSHVPEEGGASPADRPPFLHAVPEPVQVELLPPDGPLLALEHRGSCRRIVTTLGPERLRLPWWRPGPGGTRDYFKAQDEAGSWWWLFRDLATGRFFLHGQW